MKIVQSPTVERLVQTMLGRIRSTEWPVGSLVPGERSLMGEFNVSRIALREALSHLRALGVVQTEHGRGSVVRPVDASILTQLFPLVVSLGGEQSIEEMFEVRLALESRTAYLAAQRRTDENLREILRLADRFRAQLDPAPEEAIATDMEFHLAIARATQNPLFPKNLGAITEFVKYVQTMSRVYGLAPEVSRAVGDLREEFVESIDCHDDPDRRLRAVLAHDAIAESIRDRDPERARVEMEAHLRYSVLRILQSGKRKQT